MDMDKEEILAKSRRENKNKDLEEMQVLTWAVGIATRVGCSSAVCCPSLRCCFGTGSTWPVIPFSLVYWGRPCCSSMSSSAGSMSC